MGRGGTKRMRVDTSGCASTAATSTEPEASSGGAERSAQTAHTKTFLPTIPAPSRRPAVHCCGANRGAAQQFGRFTTMYSLPSGGPAAQQAVVTGCGGAKQAGRDDPRTTAADSTWSREIEAGRHGGDSTWSRKATSCGESGIFGRRRSGSTEM